MGLAVPDDDDDDDDDPIFLSNSGSQQMRKSDENDISEHGDEMIEQKDITIEVADGKRCCDVTPLDTYDRKDLCAAVLLHAAGKEMGVTEKTASSFVLPKKRRFDVESLLRPDDNSTTVSVLPAANDDDTGAENEKKKTRVDNEENIQDDVKQ